jgi:cytosine/adenosine deaminase-related metal-dependent hydrolase
VIRNAGCALVYDATARGHRYAEGIDIAFSGTSLTHVGAGYVGPADTVIDGRDWFVMPGLVDIHSHPASEPLNKGFLDELGSPRLYQSSLYEFMPLFRPDEEGRDACVEVALSELMLSGVTTVVDLSLARDGWLDVLAASGMRAVAAPMYRSGPWRTRNGHVVEYELDEAAGRMAMEQALAVVDAAPKHPCGRLSGMVAPAQIDTCTEGLIRDSLDAAADRGVPFQIHAAQSGVEFQEITRRHGMTPIEWLDHLGALRPGTIIGHCIFLNDHPWLHWPQARDFAKLAESGAAVAHCPGVFQRRGIALNSLGRYRRAGIPVGMGVDTFPHNMLEEMRSALYCSRLMSGDVFDLRTADVVDCATIGGAAILGRDDIGRLSPGAKADFFMADLKHPAMQPVRDPLRSMIYTAAERAVRHVFIDGVQTVRDGRVLTFDLPAALERVEAAQRRAESGFRQLDFAGRTHAEASPFAYPGIAR